MIRLAADDRSRVTDVLCEAFHDYPVMRFVLGPSKVGYDERLRRLVGFFVAARALRDEPLLGIEAGGPGMAADGELVAAALVSFPGGGESPPELGELREQIWAELGREARSRYEACGRVWKPLVTLDQPHIHLNMIGVRKDRAGQGLGRQLLDQVHRISRERPGSTGVTLTTEDPSNVGLYEYLGYELLGHGQIAPELETWSFFRRDASGHLPEHQDERLGEAEVG